jgi:glycosyltransferase involved in cell wall biosynthesis
MPAVSVCIPTYNYARFLPRAIESVLAQTFEDFELIVCDNASTDETPAVLAGFSDPRLKTFRNERNLGLFGNFSRCLELADGELVKYVCADDWLDPDYLARAVPVMEAHPEIGLLTTAGFFVDEQGRTFALATAEFEDGPVVRAADALRAQAAFLNVIGMPSSVLARREAVEAVGGFDPRFAPASDVHLWLKLLCRHDLGWLPEPLCYLRVHRSKEHEYGDDPSESTFLSWEDVARRHGSRIDAETLAVALYAEAERSLLHAAAYLAMGRPRRALRILRFTGRHVRWTQVLPRFARRLPALLRGQIARIRALRSGRIVVYGRGVRAGAPLESLDRAVPRAGGP